MDGVRDTILLVAGRGRARGRPNAGGRLPHRHRKSHAGEHRYIIGHVTKRGDLGQFDPERPGQRGYPVALVGEVVGHIEIIRLGTHNRRLLADHCLCALLELAEQIMVALLQKS